MIILYAARGWQFLSPPKLNFQNTHQTYISVIVPFRNEENNLPELIHSIENLDYQSEKFEVLFVNDHSTDKGCEIINACIERNNNVRLIHLNKDKQGKKEAVNLGIENSRGELCLLSDADCIYGTQWLQSFHQFYLEENKPSMIIGLVDYAERKSFIHPFVRLEFLSLVITGAGMAALAKPVFCNGANLAIRKADYNGLGSLRKEKISGDDVFLLHDFIKSKKKICVLKSQHSIVYTLSPETLKDFFCQRMRWGSKAISYRLFWPLMLTFLVFFTSVVLISGFIYSLLICRFNFFIYGLIAKITADLILFVAGLSFFNYRRFLFPVLFLELFYPFYIVVAAFAGIKKPFQWKGRE